MAFDSSPQWRDIDEVPVPVRSGSPVRVAPERTGIPVSRGTTWNIRLSAVTGIVLALIAIGFYFGVDNLRGSLTDDETGTKVTITADGHFSPNEMEVAAGTTITIVNEHADPQVLKASSEQELFPTQLIFGEPFTFAIPRDVTGMFVYGSETLPASEVLTIIVDAPIESVAAESSSSEAFATTTDEIPIPFGDITPPEVVSSAPIASSASSVSSTEHSNETPTINLGGGNSNPPPTSVGTAEIPTNPFTVAWGKDNPGSGSPITQQQPLHSGAPRQTVHPRTVTETGPRVWIILIPASLLMLLAYRRNTKVA